MFTVIPYNWGCNIWFPTTEGIKKFFYPRKLTVSNFSVFLFCVLELFWLATTVGVRFLLKLKIFYSKFFLAPGLTDTLAYNFPKPQILSSSSSSQRSMHPPKKSIYTQFISNFPLVPKKINISGYPLPINDASYQFPLFPRTIYFSVR